MQNFEQTLSDYNVSSINDEFSQFDSDNKEDI
jgi:hypothetical protein